MDADIRHLRQFLAVAEERSFSRAAARLGMAQPPLSQAIQKLEERLGATLFERTSRSVTLTGPGRALLDHARPLLEHHERLLRSVRHAASGASGHLDVAFVMSAGFDILPRALRSFRMVEPDISLSLHELTTAQQVDALKSGRCDLGLLRPPLFGGGGLTVEIVLREPVWVALPHGHPMAASPVVALTDLAEEDFIAPPARLGPGLHGRMLDACQAAGFTPRITQEATQMPTIVSLVAGGLGVALVPRSVAALGLAGVVFRPLSAARPLPTADLAIAWRREASRRRPYIRRFVDTVRHTFEEP